MVMPRFQNILGDVFIIPPKHHSELFKSYLAW